MTNFGVCMTPQTLTFNGAPRTLNFNGRIIELRRPLVMGIINVTPDSFYGDSRAGDADAALWKASMMLEEGADILDVGACSTRPGSSPIDADTEMKRLALALTRIRSAFPEALISVDTFRATIAQSCIEEFGVQIINDVSGGSEEMFETVAERQTGYVLMHTRGTPSTMQRLTDYADVTAEVLSEMAFKVDRLRAMGVCNLIVDPGFGFAKTVDQNYELIRNLYAFRALDAPVLAGLSRKSMVGKVLGLPPKDCLEGTVALNAAALMKGADILRVHDVKAAVHTVKIIERLL